MFVVIDIYREVFLFFFRFGVKYKILRKSNDSNKFDF